MAQPYNVMPLPGDGGGGGGLPPVPPPVPPGTGVGGGLTPAPAPSGGLPPEMGPYPPAPSPSTPLSIPGTTATPGSGPMSLAALRTPAYARMRFPAGGMPTMPTMPMGGGPGTPVVGGGDRGGLWSEQGKERESQSPEGQALVQQILSRLMKGGGGGGGSNAGLIDR